MSHFVGLVILTPEYAKEHTLEDSLSKYDENMEVDSYVYGKVEEYEKVSFLRHYNKKVIGDSKSLAKRFYDDCHNKEGFFTKAQLAEKWGKKEDEIEDSSYIEATPYWNRECYANWFKDIFPEVFEKFAECYEENGEDWNDNSWKLNEETGIWEEFSKYNPDSKWDWYSIGGRWNQGIKTKSGENVNACFLGEIDWSPFKPEDYCKEAKKDLSGKEYYPLKDGVNWHFTSESVPFCVIIDGDWYERGQMGFWACVANEKDTKSWNEEFMELIKNLPENSEVYNVDFHI